MSFRNVLVKIEQCFRLPAVITSMLFAIVAVGTWTEGGFSLNVKFPSLLLVIGGDVDRNLASSERWQNGTAAASNLCCWPVHREYIIFAPPPHVHC